MTVNINPQQDIFEVAKKALGLWGWPESSQVALIKMRENAVFGITTPDGRRAVLRLHRPNYHGLTSLISELQWMAALHKDGIPTCEAIATLDGRLIVSCSTPDSASEYFIDMLDWIDGTPVGSAESRQYGEVAGIETLYRELGGIAGQIHLQSETWATPPRFWRPSWDLCGCIGGTGYIAGAEACKPLWGSFSELDRLTGDQRKLLETAAERISREMAEFGETRDRYGMIHGDLVPDNLMETKSGLVAIDFDDCGYGWYLWEFATAVFWHIGESTYDSAWQGYVSGYRNVRELPDSHLALMPAMLTMRALVYLGWMHSRRDTATAHELTDHVISVSVQLANELLAKPEPLFKLSGELA